MEFLENAKYFSTNQHIPAENRKSTGRPVELSVHNLVFISSDYMIKANTLSPGKTCQEECIALVIPFEHVVIRCDGL